VRRFPVQQKSLRLGRQALRKQFERFILFYIVLRTLLKRLRPKIIGLWA
jgi:hypothetical protein